MVKVSTMYRLHERFGGWGAEAYGPGNTPWQAVYVGTRHEVIAEGHRRLALTPDAHLVVEHCGTGYRGSFAPFADGGTITRTGVRPKKAKSA